MDITFALNIIYIVRHGIAEDGFGKPDAERELTDKGREKMHGIGARLKTMGVSPSLIITSPYIRAMQTATIIAEELGYKEQLQQDLRLTPISRFEEFTNLFSENRSAQEIMFVGHEPSAGEFVSAICGGGKLKMDFKKGAVCAIGIERMRPLQGTLLWYATPLLFGT